jgi:DNA segregation ATPase FtsK/SpoIIIE-like protein
LISTTAKWRNCGPSRAVCSTIPEEDENLRNRLPYMLILIDELADLMMLERANVEECITRLAQMARAVGMHLVLATQRPSVDVITGLIKANFPSRISFRVATRVDSRTVLDSHGRGTFAGQRRHAVSAAWFVPSHARARRICH